jgi:O-antigen ligase
MPEAADTQAEAALHATLNSDGRRHPLENRLAVFTLICGIVAFAVGWVVRLHVLASWLGLAALLVGFYAQMISATREERVIIITGLIAAFVGGALGLAHGGFLP